MKKIFSEKDIGKIVKLKNGEKAEILDFKYDPLFVLDKFPLKIKFNDGHIFFLTKEGHHNKEQNDDYSIIKVFKKKEPKCSDMLLNTANFHHHYDLDFEENQLCAPNEYFEKPEMSYFTHLELVDIRNRINKLIGE